MSPRRLELTVPPERDGVKVDLLLRRELRLSGTVIRRVKWLPDGILLDGMRAQTGTPAHTGQRLSVLVGDAGLKSGMIPVPGPLEIVYEDEDLLLINKAPGVLVHPGPGHYSDTIGNYLAYYYEIRGIMADFHPVHRLDKGTTGLLMVAKHAHAQERMKRQLHTPDFRRLYLAVCEGAPQPPAGRVDAPIARAAGSLMAREVRPGGQEARTRYETLSVKNGRALVRLELETGRTHQIRVHMAYLGHPLTGDFLYGAEDSSLIARPALHSAQMYFRHPVTGAEMAFSLPPPDDLAALVH